jgi:hypothetical protein
LEEAAFVEAERIRLEEEATTQAEDLNDGLDSEGLPQGVTDVHLDQEDDLENDIFDD